MTANNQQKTDNIYANEQAQIDDFSFNQHVVEVFPDMIGRSVPGYATIVDGIGRLSAEFAHADTTLYDLGCSLGAVSLSLAKYNPNCKVVGVDNSPAMVERCRSQVNAYSCAQRITVLEDDISTININEASVIVMNFTMQFIEQSQRQMLCNKLFNALLPGGVLIISEKLKYSHADAEQAIVSLHHQFKRENGYSDLEISQKRTALENVMVLDDFECHQQRLKQAGFNSVNLWYQCYNFASFFAVKAA